MADHKGTFRYLPRFVAHQLDVVAQDVRYAVRMIGRAPTLSIAVVLTLALGLGINSVVVSLFNGLLFRAPVSRDPATFVQIYARPSGPSFGETYGPDTLVTLEDFRVVRAEARTLAAVTVSRWASFRLGEQDGAPVRGKFVSCNYLSTHVGPLRLGRGLAEADCSSPGGQPVVVLTQRGWELYFGRDPAIVGRAIRVSGHTLTVIGVAPDDAAGDPVAAVLYVPYTMQPVLQGPADFFRDPPGRHAWLNLSGRLHPGRSRSEAQAELDVIARSLDRGHPGQVTGMLVTDGAIIHEPNTTRTMPLLIALCLATTILILLMVCGNVTTLLLARAIARRQEMVVRVSLGGRRARLVRQLLTETMILAGFAGAVSLALAYYLPRPLAQLLTDFPLLDAFAPDWRVFGVTLGLVLLAGCLAGLSPALETFRFDLATALKPAGYGDSGHVSASLRRSLMTYQLSITLALLITIGLTVRSQARLLNVTLDYDADATIVTSIDLTRAGYTGQSARAFYDGLNQELEALPGVRSMALTSPAPFRGDARLGFRRDGGARSVLASTRSVSPGYFSIAGMRLLRGRVFSDLEARTPQRVMPIVVSQSFAGAFFHGSEAMGERITFGNDEVARIVGVVSDTSSIRPADADPPMLYQPIYAANVATIAPMIRFAGDSRSLIHAIRSRIQAIDPRLSPIPETVADAIARDADRYTAVIRMTAIPAGLAVLLSLIGIYGLAAFAAVQRTHEIGVRMALGARPRDVVVLFLASLRGPFAMGALGGGVLAAIGVTLLQRTSLMIHVSAGDPLAYGSAIALLMCGGAGATVIPALRATRREPWSILREH